MTSNYKEIEIKVKPLVTGPLVPLVGTSDPKHKTSSRPILSYTDTNNKIINEIERFGLKLRGLLTGVPYD